MGPMECFEVIRIRKSESAAMKMMHPLDLSVRVYGGFVRTARDDHLQKQRNVCEKDLTEGRVERQTRTLVHGT